MKQKYKVICMNEYKQVGSYIKIEQAIDKKHNLQIKNPENSYRIYNKDLKKWVD